MSLLYKWYLSWASLSKTNLKRLIFSYKAKKSIDFFEISMIISLKTLCKLSLQRNKKSFLTRGSISSSKSAEMGKIGFLGSIL